MAMNRPTAIAVFALPFFAVALPDASAELAKATRIQIRIAKPLSSLTSMTGQPFQGSVAKDVVVGGKTVVAAGTPVQGKIIYVKRSGPQAGGVLRLQLTSVSNQEVSSSEYAQQGKKSPRGSEAVIETDALVTFVVGSPDGARQVPRRQK
jgi:hypothetical protein